MIVNTHTESLVCVVFRCWCPDRTLAQARKFVHEAMGEKYAEGVILDLEKTYEESDPVTPLICLLSMGSDPTNNIELLAKKLKLDCRAISMGQGQEVHARRLLQQSMTNVRHCRYSHCVPVLHSAGRLAAATELSSWSRLS